MIKILAGEDEEINRKVRDWLAYHGFLYYPYDVSAKVVKKAISGESEPLVVFEDSEQRVEWFMVVREGTWEEREKVYDLIRVEQEMRVYD